MPEIGMFGKLAWYFLGIIRHSELLSLKRPPSAYRAERRFAKLFCNWVGFYPFRGPDASLTRQPSYQEPRSGATLTQTGTVSRESCCRCRDIERFHSDLLVNSEVAQEFGLGRGLVGCSQNPPAYAGSGVVAVQR